MNFHGLFTWDFCLKYLLKYINLRHSITMYIFRVIAEWKDNVYKYTKHFMSSISTRIFQEIVQFLPLLPHTLFSDRQWFKFVEHVYFEHVLHTTGNYIKHRKLKLASGIVFAKFSSGIISLSASTCQTKSKFLSSWLD